MATRNQVVSILKEAIAKIEDDVIHLSFASPWVDPRVDPGEPMGIQGEWHSFGISFFLRGGGELFCFGNDFAGSWGHTHGIYSTFDQWYIALDQSFFAPFYFISVPNFDIMLWVFIFPPREGLCVINFTPFTQGL